MFFEDLAVCLLAEGREWSSQDQTSKVHRVDQDEDHQWLRFGFDRKEHNHLNPGLKHEKWSNSQVLEKLKTQK